MFPNAAVQGVLVRRGAPISGANALGVDSLVRIGMIPLSIDVQPQYLAVKISSAHAKVAPHAQQTVAFHVSDRSGHAVKGQLTVIVANDAILQLSGYRAPDLVKIVLRDQPIATRFADNRPDVTLAQPNDVAQKGWGYGGGFLAGAAGTRVRTQFLPLAYFNGAVQTDAAGNAHVTFTTPDNLTTWRVMAVAITADSRPRFGTSDATFITTKPLVTDPLLPAFARPGDRFDAGLLLMNATSSPVDARTQALLSGESEFHYSYGGTDAGTTTVRAGSERMAFPDDRERAGAGVDAVYDDHRRGGFGRIPSSAGDSDGGRFRVVDGFGRNANAGERSRNDWAERRYRSSSNRGIAGAAGGASRDERARRGQNRDAYADRGPAGHQRIASRPSKNTRKSGRPDRRGFRSFRATSTQLGAMQRLDGGFAFWPGSGSSDAFGTADAIRTLAYARSSGVRVPRTLFTKAKPYLVRALGDPAGVAKWCTSVPCKTSMRLAMLQALAAAGRQTNRFLAGDLCAA